MADKKKNIPEQKLKAFSIGTMAKRKLSKRELEDLRKKEEEKAVAHVFQEFVETFQEVPSNGSKAWVKAGTYDAGARKEDTREKGKLYKPQSKITIPQDVVSSVERAQATARILATDKPERLGRKKAPEKSNLEAFKEELRRIQEEREERHKYKSVAKASVESEMSLLLKSEDLESDLTTTNLFLRNLNPKVTEQQLMEIFGRYGPLASIKIIWPRSEEEKAKGSNCGFVAYMARKDAERALRNLNEKEISGSDIKLGWGKPVILPPFPIYIPPPLMELSMPPPPSGLPFNAQPIAQDRDILPKTQDELNQILYRAVVKVVMPKDRALLILINRMVEFVVREGPMFEAMIMNREINNPMFRFLFENQSPSHIYYRWKVFSITHGESQREWSNKEFRMFKEGSIWKPPVKNCYTTGMPDDLVDDDGGKDSAKASLSKSERDRLEHLIRHLTPETKKIGEVMVFCIDHAEAAEEVSECIKESLSNESTIITKKIARLYLLSDILHNCGVKVNKASFYRRAIETRLVDIMRYLKQTYDKLEGRLQAEGFKARIYRTMKAWEDSIYPKDFMREIENAFLGLEKEVKKPDPDLGDDIDGDPLQDAHETDEDTPMDGAALLKGALKQQQQQHQQQFMRSPTPGGDTDIDGEEIQDMDENVKQDGSAKSAPPSSLSGFILSKWETVDPEQVEAQAMTTSKWDLLESDNSQDSPNQNSNDNSEFREVQEKRRTKLREIEVKVVQYQDELESGSRNLRSGWTVQQQVQHYRRKLLKKYEDEITNETDKEVDDKSEKGKTDYDKSERGGASSDDSYYKSSSAKKKKKRKRSNSRHRSKSRSPSRKRKGNSPPSARKRRSSPESSRSRGHRDRSLSPYSSPRTSSARSSRHSIKSPSPVKYRSPSPRRYRDTTRETRKHKHKHRY
ncbi:U2 snRNP-associated SURP motif-containing protein [Agrilus planipennis]|uniref:U2 snRNP-associated SURP motif-containing protein n=1 Tax=Agrilus planipennis TaxID=224129 RepID=A0A1W4X8J8_AGRPL|nr:U2 snRNP-associated SURP motif-containing protein [Agrilus planipennis]